MTTLLHKAALLPAVTALIVPALFAAPAQAGILHKHPKAAGIAAGLAAHHMAKKSASKGHHGVMARHPKATGLAAGLAAHHALKKK